MTKQTYLLWKVDSKATARIARETIKLRWNPGREQQFIEMVTRWEAQDGRLPVDPPAEAEQHV